MDPDKRGRSKNWCLPLPAADAEAREQKLRHGEQQLHHYNNDNGTEIARFDLSEDASTETAMVFGELYRHGAEWKF
ncbi:TerD family protein [Escherichia coli]